MKWTKVFKVAGWILVGLTMAVGLGLVLGILVMLLWNWLMPPIFGLPEITYWQGVGLFILSHLLFRTGHAHRSKEMKVRSRARFKKEFRKWLNEEDEDVKQEPDVSAG